VSEVMHFISHVYHTISDMRVAFIKAPPSSFQTRPGLQPVTTTAAPPSTQHPTSTQTTFTSQSMPSVRDFRLDCKLYLILILSDGKQIIITLFYESRWRRK